MTSGERLPATLGDIVRCERYEVDARVVRAGERIRQHGVIRRGAAKAVVQGAAGREAMLALLGPGDAVDPVASLRDLHTATVIALEPLEVLAAPAEQIASAAARDPAVALWLLAEAKVRLDALHRSLVQMATLDVVGRVAAKIIELGQRAGVEGPDGLAVESALRREDLASWVGASPQATTAALRVLRSIDAIDTGRRRITIKDASALRERARV